MIDEINNSGRESECANRKMCIGEIIKDDEINKQVESMRSMLPFS